MSSNESEHCEVDWCDRPKGHSTIHSVAVVPGLNAAIGPEQDSRPGARGPILVHPFDQAPFDLKAFARSEIPAEFSISYIAEIPPSVDNPLDEQELLSELFSHPRKEGWGLFVSYSRRPVDLPDPESLYGVLDVPPKQGLER